MKIQNENIAKVLYEKISPHFHEISFWGDSITVEILDIYWSDKSGPNIRLKVDFTCRVKRNPGDEFKNVTTFFTLSATAKSLADIGGVEIFRDNLIPRMVHEGIKNDLV